MKSISLRLPITAASLLLTTTLAFQQLPPLTTLHLQLSTVLNRGITALQSTVDVSPGKNIKYPTVRGSEVDSRKIVSEPLLALRVGHVLFAGEELAMQVSTY